MTIKWRALERPPIGVPRQYPGEIIPVLYPGEIARSLPVDIAPGATPQGWLVEPDPTWAGWRRRWMYRLVGQWLPGGVLRPSFEVDMYPVQDDEEER